MSHDDASGSDPVDALRARMRYVPGSGGALPRFDPDTAPERPADLFAHWLIRALDDGVPEPQVMTLSTVDATGRPTARVLLLRGLDNDAGGCGFRFATDAASPKGHDLAERPHAALTWYWPAHGRQVRATGPVERMDAATARADFGGRGDAARIAGFTGAMSGVLAGGPAEFAREHDRAAARLAADPDAVPSGHAVYRLWADETEFFQLAADRFHRRLRYRRAGDGWERAQLWP